MASNEDYGSLTAALRLDVGPHLSSRQKKAAAAFTVSQLLALAELRAYALRKQSSGRTTRHNGALARSRALAAGSRANAGLASVFRLRQNVTKRKAEEETDAAAAAAAQAPQRPRSAAAAAVTSVAVKRIAVQPPTGTALPPTPAAAANLGCHLARRGGGGAGPSSLARVYGGRVRVAELPEDYAECFVGLEPVRQQDELDELNALNAQRRAASAAGGATAAAAEGVAAGLAAPLMGGALLGSVTNLGEEMSLLFAANGGLQPLVPGAPSMYDGPGATTAAAVPLGAPEGSLMGAPFVGSVALDASGLAYSAAPYGAPLAAGFGDDGAGVTGRAVAPLLRAGTAEGASELMIDAEDDSSTETEDRDGISAGVGIGGSQAIGSDAALEAAFGDFGSGEALPLTQARAGEGFAAGFGAVGAAAGMYGYGSGSGTAVGMQISGAAPGGSAGGGTMDDDSAMVEEF